jgi:hypothetical protein
VRKGLGGALVGGALAAALACSGSDDDREPGGTAGRNGFVDEDRFRAQQDDYLAAASEELVPDSALNVLAHAERARRDRGFRFDPGANPSDFTASFEKIDTMEDTSDFDLLYLMNLWYGYRDDLGGAMREAIEQRILAFKYWYTEPTPEGIIDDKYYWSENHRIIFHTLEYLAGQAFPDERFANDGRTGDEHRRHAEELIERWLTEKARFGFSEWHSDVYYQKDVTPLLSLVEWAEDEALAERAAMVLDLVLFDVALHLHRGTNGATHGRSYMKDKSTATDEDVFGLAKLLFDDTSLPYPSPSDPGATLLARSRRYRLPEVIRRVATSDETGIDRERMGVPLDPVAPLEDNPQAPYGYDFDDPDNVDFWWDREALTAWQVVPLTLATADRYDLWETELFQPFVPLRDTVNNDPVLARQLAQSLGHMVAFGLLSEANTYTFRSPEVMLSTVQDHRPGALGFQYHAWQATLDERALVFTTHPLNEPEVGTEWPDSDGYWTGTGSMPRSAQQGSAAIHLYAPRFASPGAGPLEVFSYLPYTHAYFPREHFDEVVTEGGWTFGRKGDGYVALWSWRPVRWREHDPERVFTHGMREPFDLVAEDGADNVWIVEVGDAERSGTFEDFRRALTAAPLEVVDLGEQGDVPAGFEVRYRSPSEGTLEWASEGPFRVDGEEVALDGYPRHDNRWARTAFEAPVVEIADGGARLVLDFEAGRRSVSGS